MSHRRDEDREHGRHEARRPGVWSSQYEWEVLNQAPSSTTQRDGQRAEHPAPSNNLLRFLKLKEEVVKNAQAYIPGHAAVICRTLAPDHEAVKCLSAFGEKAQKFAAHDRVGHPALEAPGALPSASSAQVALHT